MEGSMYCSGSRALVAAGGSEVRRGGAAIPPLLRECGS